MIEIENKKEERSKFQDFKHKFKDSLFQLYYELNDQVDINLGFTFVIMTYSFLNLFSFALSSQINVINQNSSSASTIVIINVLNSSYYMKQSANMINLSVLVIFFLIVLVILLYMYLLYDSIISGQMISKNRNNVLKIIVYYTSTVIFWMLFMPLIDINLQIFSYPSTQTDYYFANNIITSILSVVNIFFILIITLFHAYLGNKSFYSSVKVDGFSRADCDFEVIYIFVRLMLVLGFFLTLLFKINYIYFIILNCIISLVLLRFNFSILLYYNDLISKLFNYLLFIYIWVIICVIIITITNYKDPIWMLICGVIFILPIANSIYHYTLNNIINEIEFTKLIHMPFKADIYLKNLNTLIKNESNPVILSGITDCHTKECPLDDCIIKKKELFYIPSLNEFIFKEDNNKKNKNYSLVFLLSVYKYYLKTIKHLVIMNSYLNFQFEEIGNLTDLVYNLYTMDRKNITLQQEFSFYRILFMAFYRIEEEFMYTITENDNSSCSLDVRKVLDYYTLVNSLKLMMVKCGNANYTFWNSFIFNSDNTPVYDNGINIFEMNHLLDILYSRIRSIYTHDKEITSKYSEYIRLIRGDERLAQKIFNMVDRVDNLDEIKSLEKITSLKEFFFSNNSIISIVSFSKDRSVIEKITESVFQIYGYTTQQILGKEVETLLSPFFRKRHANYVRFHFETGIKRTVGKERFFYGYTKNHLIFPIKLLVMVLPNLEKKMLYMSIQQKLPQEYGVILVTPNGKIDSISEKLSAFLGISGEAFTENELYIYYIIASYFYEEGENGKHLIKNVDLKNFRMSICESKKMVFCTEKSFIEDIKKTSKQFELETRSGISNNTNSSLLHKKFLSIIQKKDSKWPKLDTEITEENYNNGIDKEENTLFIIKVYNNDEISSSIEDKSDEKINRKLQILPNDIFKSADDRKVVKKISEFEIKNKISNVKKIFQQQKILNDTVNKTIDNEREGGSSLSSSIVTSSFYTNYSNFRKKLQKCLNEEQKSNLSNYTGWILLIILLISSIVIYIIQVSNLNSIYELFYTFSKPMTIFDDINCIDKNMNSLILRSIYSSDFNLTSSRSKMYKCIENVINGTNQIIQISNSQIIKMIKMQVINTNVNIMTIQNNTDGSIPMIYFLSNLIRKIILLDTENFPLTLDLLEIKLNFRNLVYNLFTNFSNSILSISNNLLSQNMLLNSLYLGLRLFAIFLCFIVIVPIIIIKKRDQLKILETFFHIKTEDAEIQRENCKDYLSKTSNIRIEENENEEKGENPKEVAENQMLIDKKKKSKSKGKKGDEETKKSLTKKTKSFSSNGYAVKVFMLIMALILVISIVPIINFFYESQMMNASSQFINYKLNVDNYTFSIERLFIETQNIFIYALSNKSISSSDLKLLSNSININQNMSNSFSAFSLNSNQLIYYSDLNQMLVGDICTIYSNYNYSNTKCIEIEATRAQKGLNALLNEETFYITQFDQEIINNNGATINYVATTMNDTRWAISSSIFDVFIVDGFNIILMILLKSYNDLVSIHSNRLTILFTSFIVIIVINQFVVWLKIEKKIHSMETDTYKLFSIIPLRFISDYNNLSDYLKKITQDED